MLSWLVQEVFCNYDRFPSPELLFYLGVKNNTETNLRIKVFQLILDIIPTFATRQVSDCFGTYMKSPKEMLQ